MTKMLRKSIGMEHTCKYGEGCCGPFVMGRRSKPRVKKMQRRIARRREMNQWKKENS